MLPSAALLFGTPRLRVASQCPRRGGAGGRSGWGPGGRGPRPGIGRSLQTLLSKWLVGSGGRDHPGRRGSNNTHSVLTLAPKVRVLARPPPPPPQALGLPGAGMQRRGSETETEGRVPVFLF